MRTYYVYTTNGFETLTDICRNNRVSLSDVIRINSQSLTVGTTTMITSDYLSKLQKSGNPVIPNGVQIRIPGSFSGGLELNESTYNIHSSFRGRVGTSRVSDTWKKFNCYMYVLLNGGKRRSWTLPVYPQEFSDSNRPNYNAQGMLGRSVDYQIYQSSSRSVSFTLNLHEELCSNYNYIHSLVSQIESASYPGYSGGIVQVPEVCFVIGSHFKVRGIITECSATWKAPIINGKLVNCDLSIGVTETSGPFSSSDIASRGGRR